MCGILERVEYQFRPFWIAKFPLSKAGDFLLGFPLYVACSFSLTTLSILLLLLLLFWTFSILIIMGYDKYLF